MACGGGLPDSQRAIASQIHVFSEAFGRKVHCLLHDRKRSRDEEMIPGESYFKESGSILQVEVNSFEMPFVVRWFMIFVLAHTISHDPLKGEDASLYVD